MQTIILVCKNQLIKKMDILTFRKNLSINKWIYVTFYLPLLVTICNLIVNIWQPEGHRGAGWRHHHVLWVELKVNEVRLTRLQIYRVNWAVAQRSLYWPGHTELHSCGLHWGRRLSVRSLRSRCGFDRPLNHWKWDNFDDFLDSKIWLIEPDHELGIRRKGGL